MIPRLRDPIEAKIDDAWHRMVFADTRESKMVWGRKYVALIQERNANRTPAEIERLERERGLRQ